MVGFYTAALADEKIGFIFKDVAKLDLESHLPVIGDFWETILFQNGVYARYGRTPLMVHGELNEKTPLLFDHFTRWLEAEHPRLVDGYRSLYARKYAPTSYRKEVHAIFNALRDKYGLNRRERPDDRDDEPVTLAEQQMLKWKD
jgi:hypothetical protein